MAVADRDVVSDNPQPAPLFIPTDAPSGDPAVVAWHVDVTYQVLGSKKRGVATGQGESLGMKRLLNRERQIGGVRYVPAVKDVSFVAAALAGRPAAAHQGARLDPRPALAAGRQRGAAEPAER